jgi:hypothetical protein
MGGELERLEERRLQEGDLTKLAVKGGAAVGLTVLAVWMIGFWGLLVAAGVGIAGWKLGRESR